MDAYYYLRLFSVCFGLCFVCWLLYRFFRWWLGNEPYDTRYWWDDFDWPFSFDFSSSTSSSDTSSSDDS